VHGEPPDDIDASVDDDDDGPLRGWVPQDDRLWLHPSERAAALGASPGTTVRSATHTPRAPGGRWMIGGLAACVAATVVVAGLALVTADRATDSSPATGRWVVGVPTTEVDLSSLTTPRHLSAVARSTHDSTVALMVDTAGRTTVRTGIVAEAGGIVVALAPALARARSVTVVEPDGTRQPATLVGTDAATRISVLRIGDDLPAATFSTTDPSTGSVAVVEAEEHAAAHGTTPAVRLYAGTVLYAGVATGAGPSGRFCATGVDAPLTPSDLGSPLVDTTGAVSGILDAVQGTGRSRTSVFLPAELVRDVTDQIVSRGRVDHGSLGVQAVDPAPGSGLQGAEVSSVADGSAGDQAGLQVGDVLVGVDGRAVRSVAELDTRLYGDPPGSELRVTVERDGSTFQALAVLTAA
jgi:putative serine protease PepD